MLLDKNKADNTLQIILNDLGFEISPELLRKYSDISYLWEGICAHPLCDDNVILNNTFTEDSENICYIIT